MCGIVGAIGRRLDHGMINKYLGHRGPDEQNGYCRDGVDLYHVRLAIQAIADGQQPLHLGDRYTIVFNGEIYNHTELVQKHQVQTETGSDTESILHLFRQMGKEAFVEMDGMFALSIVDWDQRKVHLVRDRAGKKPLYVYRSDREVVWCSELRTLQRLVRPGIDETGIQQYLYAGYCLGEQTCYDRVTEVRAGGFYTIDIDTLAYTKDSWWSYPTTSTTSPQSVEEWQEQVDGLLQKSVRNRMVSSELEVGTFLSGGIDSGLVTAVAAGMVDRLRTFTVAFPGQYDESPLAALVAKKYSTNHTVLHIDLSNLKDDVSTIFANYGEPFSDTSAIPSYYVSKAAREHISVILNGDGADELFGGYRRYVPYQYFDFLGRKRGRRPGVAFLAKVLEKGKASHRSPLAFFQRLLRLAGQPTPTQTYLASTSDIMVGFESAFVDSKVILEGNMGSFYSQLPSELSGLQKLMYTDFHWLLFGDLLVKMDVATMAHSLEGRSPFLSKYFLELIPHMPDGLKVKGARTKVLLRNLASRYLPGEIVDQPKRGFEIPGERWINEDLAELFKDLVAPSTALVRQFIDPHFVDGIINRKITISGYRRSKLMWSWLALQIWHQDLVG